MKKNSMKTLVAYFATQNFLPSDVADAVDEIKAELAKGEAKAQANRELYSEAHDVVMAHLTDTPMTVTDLVTACGDELPEGMSKSKIQYALLNYWNDEVVKIENAKGANQYKRG